MGGNIPGGSFLLGKFPGGGGDFPGESLMGGNFPGENFNSFPDSFNSSDSSNRDNSTIYHITP